MSKPLFPVFRLSVCPSTKASPPSRVIELKILNRSLQREGRKGAKADGICDRTCKTKKINWGSEKREELEILSPDKGYMDTYKLKTKITQSVTVEKKKRNARNMQYLQVSQKLTYMERQALCNIESWRKN